MADQAVKVTNFPKDGSEARVAYELYEELKYAIVLQQPATLATIANQHLTLFAQCRRAVTGGLIDTTHLK